MATYNLKTQNDIKFICILNREVSKSLKINYYSYIEYSNNVFQFRGR